MSDNQREMAVSGMAVALPSELIRVEPTKVDKPAQQGAYFFIQLFFFLPRRHARPRPAFLLLTVATGAGRHNTLIATPNYVLTPHISPP